MFISGNYFINSLTFVLIVALLIYLYFKWSFTYWNRCGIPSLNATFPFGSVKNFILQKSSFSELLAQVYDEIKNKKLQHAGIYFFNKPIYVPIDPEIIKRILIGDFNHFVNRGFSINEETDPIGANLLSLEGDKWKSLRARLTPTFTSGKIKTMFSTIVQCSKELHTIMDKFVKTGEEFDIKDIFERFTTDVIGNCAFGIKVNSLLDPNSPFLKHSRRVFTAELKDGFNFFGSLFLPRFLVVFFQIKITKPDVETFFTKIVKDTIEYREANNIKRNDFMDFLIDLKNNGVVNKTNKSPLTFQQVTSHALSFIAAGSATSSTTSSFALYELAKNQELQAQVREEVNRAIKDTGELTYEALARMELLERVVQETLRLHMNGFSARVCTKKYTIPNTSLELEKGTMVLISGPGMGKDSDYYPNPEVFDPDRFTEENKQSRPSCAWLAFGEGPRNCIGMRFGMMQTKVGLAVLLKNYNFTIGSKTLEPLQIEPACVVVTVKGGIWLNITKI